MPASLVHVVDDDPAMRDSVGFLLGTEGFEVRLYETATDFLQRLVEPAAGCVLTDIRMPVSTAWSCSAACGHPATSFRLS